KLSELLTPGPALLAPQVAEAGRPTKIAFRKPGSANAALDTVVLLDKGETINLRIAYSEDLSMNGFLSNQSAVSMDSMSLRLFNKYPEAIQPSGMRADAILYVLNNTTGEFEEVATFENFERLRLHPESITVPVRDAGGMDLTYFIRLKNTQTGAFLVDGTGNDMNVFGGLEAGKEYILMLAAIEMNYGSGPFHFFVIEPVVL
ncbi:MAG: hypothetical protein ABW019_12605, partial [Chitinophagaceae bacterium]